MKQKFKNSFKEIKKNKRLALLLNIALLVPVWLFLVSPLYTGAETSKETVATLKAENETLNTIKEEILALSSSTPSTKASKESVLKQVEELAQTNSVFGRIKRLNPTEKTIAGKKRKGLNLSLEQTTLQEITPFLYAIAHKSVLDITEISIKRENGTDAKEGMVNVQLTVLGGV